MLNWLNGFSFGVAVSIIMATWAFGVKEPDPLAECAAVLADWENQLPSDLMRCRLLFLEWSPLD